MEIENLVRKNIRALVPYASAREEFSGRGEVYLDANENPFASPYNRYPDPLQKELKKRIAAMKGVDSSSVFLGNGSDEAIDLLIRAFCEPGADSILIPEPTYGMYHVAAQVNNVNVQRCPLTKDFALDYHSIRQNWNASTRIIFLCNPNNPTGNLFDKNIILKLVSEFWGLVVIDEAYIDFAEDNSFLPMLERFKNLVVLQTFSKAWGLAGLRLGMCFADPAIVRTLTKIKYPYNVNALSQRVILDTLNESEKQRAVELILNERSILAMKLAKVKAVEKVYDSSANFLLVKVTDAKRIGAYLRAWGIIVRDRSREMHCDNCLRITIGTPEENQKLVNTLNSYE